MHFVYGYKSSSEEFVEIFYYAIPPNRADRLPSDQLPMGFNASENWVLYHLNTAL